MSAQVQIDELDSQEMKTRDENKSVDFERGRGDYMEVSETERLPLFDPLVG